MEPIDKSQRPSELFGENVFNRKMMKHYLSKDDYLELIRCAEEGKTLDRKISGPVANGIKSWALDKGATHYTHWFQPLTGRTAEKHNSFLELTDGEAIDKFSGDELSQQEPDVSSFPSGGSRVTFEARGYTAWDCSSPVFIFETTYGITLCIPTIFVSFTGEALDFKTPLLRSMALIDEAAVAICKYFDPEVNRVIPTLGAEQEYFLIDRSFYDLRPDLVLTGRTVFGKPSVRGQQLDDHYFGSIPERAFAFMNELELECHRLGIPLKTRHNEVAPSQFECAPNFENLNIAIDHGLMIMDLIDRTARKHNLAALLHEKPFASINGSGKHNNWSLRTNTDKNLLSPGSNPQENLMFLTFFVTVIKAVHEHAALLRASIASAGNDRRLGNNEAPPSIISVFLGKQLTKVLDDIETPPRRKKNQQVSELLHLGIAEIPELLLDNTDRNRTSPFAFTGNKFEFRAVGSSSNSSAPMMVLNLIVAEQLKHFKKRVDSKMNRGRNKEAAILDMIREYIATSKAVRFEGDGYSDEWKKEAAMRNLPNLESTPQALAAYLYPKSLRLFASSGIFLDNEIEARCEVLINNYLNKIQTEAGIIEELAMTVVIPDAIKYQKELMENLQQLSALGLAKKSKYGLEKLVAELGKYIDTIIQTCDEMVQEQEKAEKIPSNRERAFLYEEKVIPNFSIIRDQVDRLEGILPDGLWLLPKYREMLFLN
ncbi:UNVERIFIED_CONTAM: hypothetical protein GTU68_066357 [Idotea baltica]|nr:hypothetical protein [Idotea baltica]